MDKLGRDTVWMFCAQVLRTALQIVTFVIVARLLGAAQFGVFISVVAGVSILAPFASWGTGNLLVKNVARDVDTFGASWGNALIVSLVFGCLLTIVFALGGSWIFSREVSVFLVVLVCIANLVFSKVTETAVYAFQAVERFGFATLVYVLWEFFRLLGAVTLLLFSSSHTAVRWAELYLFGSVASALVALGMVSYILGRPRPLFSLFRHDVPQGFYFSSSLSAQTVYNDVDKTMLARLSTSESAGIYAAAYRLIDAASLPISALLYAAYPRFFQKGAEGIQGSLRFAMRLLPRVLIYAAMASIGLFVIAPTLPRILGGGYSQMVGGIRLLSLLPLFRTLHYFAGDTLTSSGHQGWRTLGQGVVVVLNISGNLWLIPHYSWKGAAWVSLASDLLLGVLLWGLVLVLFARSRDRSTCQLMGGTREDLSRKDLGQIEYSQRS